MAYWSPMKKFYDARVVEVPRRKFINFIVNFIVNFSVFCLQYAVMYVIILSRYRCHLVIFTFCVRSTLAANSVLHPCCL